MPALICTECVTSKDNYRPESGCPLYFGQFHHVPVWPSSKWYTSEIMMLVMRRLGNCGWYHPVVDLIVRASEIVPYYTSFLPFYFRGCFTSARSLVELTSLILITSKASPGVKVSIVSVGNYSSTGKRCPSTKTKISSSTPPSILPIKHIWVLSPLPAVSLGPVPAP